MLAGGNPSRSSDAGGSIGGGSQIGGEADWVNPVDPGIYGGGDPAGVDVARSQLFLRLEGIPSVWFSVEVPALWSAPTGITYRRGLWPVGSVSQRIQITDAIVEQSTPALRILDEDGIASTALAIATTSNSTRTTLTANLGVAATTLAVASTTGFTDGQLVYCGLEALTIGTVASGTSLTGCARGLYPAMGERMGRWHPVAADDALRGAPFVATKPTYHQGRRWVLYEIGADTAGRWLPETAARIVAAGEITALYHDGRDAIEIRTVSLLGALRARTLHAQPWRARIRGSLGGTTEGAGYLDVRGGLGGVMTMEFVKAGSGTADENPWSWNNHARTPVIAFSVYTRESLRVAVQTAIDAVKGANETWMLRERQGVMRLSCVVYSGGVPVEPTLLPAIRFPVGSCLGALLGFTDGIPAEPIVLDLAPADPAIPAATWFVDAPNPPALTAVFVPDPLAPNFEGTAIRLESASGWLATQNELAPYYPSTDADRARRVWMLTEAGFYQGTIETTSTSYDTTATAMNPVFVIRGAVVEGGAKERPGSTDALSRIVGPGNGPGMPDPDGDPGGGSGGPPGVGGAPARRLRPQLLLWRVGETRPSLLDQVWAPGVTTVRGGDLFASDAIGFLLSVLTSTGTVGRNGPYDLYAAQWGLGVPRAMIDLASFEALRSILPASTRNRRYVFREAFNAFADIVDPEARTLGFYISIVDGKITAVRPQAPTSPTPENPLSGALFVRSWGVPPVPTLDESNRAEAGERSTVERGEAMSINGYQLSTSWDWLAEKFMSVVKVLAIAPVGESGNLNLLEAANKGIRDTPGPSPFWAYWGSLLETRIGLYSREAPAVRRSINASLRQLYAGQRVLVSDSLLPSITGGSAGVTAVPAEVLEVEYDYTERKGTVLLYLYPAERAVDFTGSAAAALADWSRPDKGWDGTQLYVRALAGPLSSSILRVPFAVGDAIRIVEMDPATLAAPRAWTVTVSAIDQTTGSITPSAALTGYSTSERYLVTHAPYASATAARRADVSYIADASTLVVGGADRVSRWA